MVYIHYCSIVSVTILVTFFRLITLFPFMKISNSILSNIWFHGSVTDICKVDLYRSSLSYCNNRRSLMINAYASRASSSSSIFGQVNRVSSVVHISMAVAWRPPTQGKPENLKYSYVLSYHYLGLYLKRHMPIIKITYEFWLWCSLTINDVKHAVRRFLRWVTVNDISQLSSTVGLTTRIILQTLL